ncbi:MAG: AraC family transcriptional regulator [Panacibacter sp.]
MEGFPKIYLYRRIVQAKLFIDENFGENIDLDNISDEAFFSKFHFIRLFKTIYNKTPYQYLTAVRIEKAKQLLTKGISVSEACFLVGFDSVTSFSGLFKRIVSLTPAAFQQQQLKRKADIAATPLKFIPNCFAENKGWTKNSNFEEVS